MGAVMSRSLFISARQHGMLLSVSFSDRRESRPKTRARPTLIRMRARACKPIRNEFCRPSVRFGRRRRAAVFHARWSEGVERRRAT